MREQFNLENFLAGKYERFETRDGKEVKELEYLPNKNYFVLEGIVVHEVRETWTKEGYYHYNNPDSIDLFGILKSQQ